MAATGVPVSRFEVLRVTKKTSIREFVGANGLDFKKGKGFYQLTKPENIQHYKEIVAYRKDDGQFITGDKIREILKIPTDVLKFRMDSSKLPDFKIFVQSTSYNRVLMPNTDFVYEADETIKTGKKRKATDSAVSGPSGGAKQPLLSSLPPPPPSYGAGGPIEIVFSFDTTGSMSSCLDAVRTNLQELIQRLYSDIPTLRMSVFAHGDYCDRHNYITKFVDFTTDINKLCKFVKDVKSTGGGDYPEAYEVVLREVREKLSWSAGTQRALVMIGDAIPHERDYPDNKLRIDWKEETDKLIRDMGVRIYGVQCASNEDSTKFFKHMTTQTHGHHLKLDNFKNIQDFIMAICYREQGDEFLQAYQTEVAARDKGSGMNAELHQLFDTLKGTSAPLSPTPLPETPKSKVRKEIKAKKTPAKTPAKAKTTALKLTSKVVKRRLFVKTALKKTAKKAPAKTTAKAKNTASKLKTTSRVPREVIGQGKQFAFRKLRWTHWEKAVVKKAGDLSETWKPMGNKVSFNEALFRKQFQCAAVYEFAIQYPGAKKNAIYLRAVQGFSKGQNWYKHLLASRDAQVRKAVRSGCTFFARRCYVTPLATTTQSLGQRLRQIRSRFVRRYDYAWNTSEYSRMSVRVL